MIAKAKAISHGINDLRYITGESQHKKHPEKIYRVLDNLLPSEPDAMGVWNSMQLTLSQHRPIKNSVIRIELSPSPEHTQFYDIEDWQKLWQNFAEEFDKQVITGKDGKVRSCPTNLAGSKYTVWLHTEYKGEVPHLHAAVCRLDEDGNINNDHNIHLRAQHAAERVAKKRGWTTAAQIRISNVHQVNRDCMDTLKSMQSWSWEEYKNALIRKGYTVHEREDKKGILHGYALVNGNTKYKASELGVGRNLMISKLPSTWRKLHHQPATIIRNNTPQAIQQATEHKAVPIDYTQNRTGRSDIIPYTLTHEGKEHRFYIPEKVLDYFNDEFDYRSVSNCKELTDMATAIFVGLLETPSVATGGGGGGSQNDLPWRDKDEDDLLWARRCARAAGRSLGKKPKTGLKR
ncbi:relaxase/mobilization nuclease domain-containing protein [Parabacteroides distasonis]|uniref:relaxase/mobilization nuclease domain-containing protein n=1 Tax=Parabacteroides distasonis TaxID=823 RepID=UPI001C3D85BB|nr:relaxase/mobilization nuclease domain-containing protein [Parabacteroides distasonis]MCR1854811.1 relaxase/mobilization nuclease domain-containing protein [Parabacteroides distasonis]